MSRKGILHNYSVIASIITHTKYTMNTYKSGFFDAPSHKIQYIIIIYAFLVYIYILLYIYKYNKNIFNKNDRVCRDVKTQKVCEQGRDG